MSLSKYALVTPRIIPPQTPSGASRCCSTSRLERVMPAASKAVLETPKAKAQGGESDKTEFLFQSYYFKEKKINSPHISAYLTERDTEPLRATVRAIH